MKAGKTIQELLTEIDRQSKSKEDYLVNTSNLRMESWDSRPMLHVLDNSGSDLIEPLDVRHRSAITSASRASITRGCSRRTQTFSPTTSTAGLSASRSSVCCAR